MPWPRRFFWLVGCVCLAASGAARQQAVRPADLLEAAADAPAPVAALYRAVARPVDRIQLADESAEIERLGPDTLLDADFAGNITARGLTIDDKPPRQFVLTRAGVNAYLPFERWALDRLARFDKEAGDLPALDRQSASEKVLTALLTFHLSVRQRPLQGSSRWADLQGEIERKLLDVRRRLLRGLALNAHDRDGWQHTLRYADFMKAAYPGDTAVATEIARLRARYALALVLQAGAKNQSAAHYQALRQQLDWLDDHAPSAAPPDFLGVVGDVLLQAGSPTITVYDPDADAIRQLLKNKAAGLLSQARAVKDDKQAVKLLESASDIWPLLPGLADELHKRKGQYVILVVGVRSLPTFLSPARAWTDVERQAVELVFEGLLQLRPGDGGRLHYQPQLAAAAPTCTASVRALALRRPAFWSNGSRLTSADVDKTFELLTAKKPGRRADLADNLEPMRSAGDPLHIAFKYNQGLLDPLAPLAFKVLPREFSGGMLQDASNEKFAQQPVGSGPFMPAGTLAEHGRNYLRFVANPYYQPGPGRAMPQICEVRLFVTKDPAADFVHKIAPMHLLLDGRSQDLGQVKKNGARLAATVPERRVWFLALNHRDPLLADDKLRRALAHGIDRERLLADHFGSGVAAFRAGPLAVWGAGGPVVAAVMAPAAASHHHALNGPFPAGSWAVCPDDRVPARLNNPATAETFLRGVKAASIDLELKYPDDDPRVEAACRAMAEQLAGLGAKVGRPIKLRLVGLPPHQLQRDVMSRKYQLAYWHHDYPTDLFSLWSLFDPREEALDSGSNFLGYKDDGSLVELLQKAASYRDFAQVKRLTHDIHVALYEKMPLVPLWQLDYHIAVHPTLTVPLLDPRAVFSTIDQWHLEKK
jgi:ABC-type transport system substrate-binding protein